MPFRRRTRSLGQRFIGAKPCREPSYEAAVSHPVGVDLAGDECVPFPKAGTTTLILGC